jgi:rhodanese-related sulfurtransferase
MFNQTKMHDNGKAPGGLNMSQKKGTGMKKTRFPIWGWIAVAIVLIAIVGIVVIKQTPPAATPLAKDITVSEAAKLRDQGAFVLDVREPSEWIQFHIPGATLIPLGELPNRLNEVPRDKTVVVVCRTGHRSAQGRDILLNAGFTNVTSMTGGVTQWQTDGLPLATGQ